MSVEPRPAITTSAPSAFAPAANASASSGEDGRMSYATTMRGTASSRLSTRTNAPPKARATSALSWSGTVPRTSYALTKRLRSDTVRLSSTHTVTVRRAYRPSDGNPFPGLPGSGRPTPMRGTGRQESARRGDDTQVTAAADRQAGRRSRLVHPATAAGAPRLAYRLGERDQVVAAGRGRLVLPVVPDQVPAARRGEAARVRLTQVVGVRLGERRQWPDHRGRLGVHIGQRRDRRLGAAVTRTTPW